jgi:hypothetical protein
MQANRLHERLPWIVIISIFVMLALQLRFQGRVWWCACGEPNPWSGNVQSRHNSQHLFDPYSLTHISHGIVLCQLLTLIGSKRPLAWRLAIAAFMESLWEVFENTSFVIERYRTATISLDYYGDSIANSLGDVFVCLIGFIIAQRMRWWGALTFFLLVEGLALIWIRDSMLLNILMLVYPIDTIKSWQMALR